MWSWAGREELCGNMTFESEIRNAAHIPEGSLQELSANCSIGCLENPHRRSSSRVSTVTIFPDRTWALRLRWWTIKLDGMNFPS